MAVVDKTLWVPYTATQMYELVADFTNYPEFLPWCGKGQVKPQSDDSVIATLSIQYFGVNQSFSTRNVNVPNQSISMHLVSGPFRSLEGLWQFETVPDGGCLVTLNMAYEFASGLLGKIVAPVFNFISSMMVEAFIKEAERRYG